MLNQGHEAIKIWLKEGSLTFTSSQNLTTAVLSAASSFEPIIAISIAGVESRKAEFAGQSISTLNDLVRLPYWPQSGPVALTEVPFTLAFLYQAMHGAVCVDTGEIALALKLAQTKLPGGNSIRLFENHAVIGWPKSLGGHADHCWKVVSGLAENWVWITDAFGTEDRYRVSLISYYVLLSMLELAYLLRSGRSNILKGKPEAIDLDVPPMFMLDRHRMLEDSKALLVEHADGVARLWRALNISDQAFRDAWPLWFRALNCWTHKLSIRLGPASTNAFSSLVDEILEVALGNAAPRLLA